jgi:signal transduction histidine kinase
VRIDADGVGRYSQDVEATVYFCVLEALQNVQKYAKASHVLVCLRESDDTLTFEVKDDGAGFDIAIVKRGAGLTNMADRLEALDGSLEVVAHSESGTCVRGRLVARSAAAVAV